MSDKVLVCTVGLPRSGKTTWCHEMNKEKGWPIVNPDSLRLAMHGQRYAAQAEPMVWAIVKIMVSALFLAGHEFVLLDATGNSLKRREDMIGVWECQFKVIDTTRAECIQRAEEEGDHVIIPVIHRMADAHEPLESGEIEFK